MFLVGTWLVGPTKSSMLCNVTTIPLIPGLYQSAYPQGPTLSWWLSEILLVGPWSISGSSCHCVTESQVHLQVQLWLEIHRISTPELDLNNWATTLHLVPSQLQKQISEQCQCCNTDTSGSWERSDCCYLVGVCAHHTSSCIVMLYTFSSLPKMDSICCSCKATWNQKEFRFSSPCNSATPLPLTLQKNPAGFLAFYLSSCKLFMHNLWKR